jgi:hypothetical protein
MALDPNPLQSASMICLSASHDLVRRSDLESITASCDNLFSRALVHPKTTSVTLSYETPAVLSLECATVRCLTGRVTVHRSKTVSFGPERDTQYHEPTPFDPALATAAVSLSDIDESAKVDSINISVIDPLSLKDGTRLISAAAELLDPPAMERYSHVRPLDETQISTLEQRLGGVSGPKIRVTVETGHGGKALLTPKGHAALAVYRTIRIPMEPGPNWEKTLSSTALASKLKSALVRD